MRLERTPGSHEFTELVDQLTETYSALWKKTPDAPPSLPVEYDCKQKRLNGRRGTRFLRDVEEALANYPHESRLQTRWRARMAVRFRRMCKQCIGYSDGLLDVLFNAESVGATRDFVHRATEFDRDIDINDLHQALRNVWVMNSIQQLLGQEVTCSASVFGYSMLYPYTDNYLDDADLSTETKEAFNEWLSLRLRGTSEAGSNSHHHAVSRLVAKIEDEHDRSKAARVFQSLLAIHDAQHDSLQQQTRANLGEEELLEMSIRKGGTSVLADGYLVNPAISAEEASFFFGYGVFLQLLDDLQDVVRDQHCQHSTLFTRVSKCDKSLDALTSRVYHFMQQVLQNMVQFSSHSFGPIVELIEKNCSLLMLQSIARHHQHFTPDFLRHWDRFSPFEFEFLRSLPVRLQRQLRRAQQRFAQQHEDIPIYSVLG